MPGWILPAAIGAGSLLGNWLGESGQEKDKRENLRRIMALFSPESISGDTSKMFSMFQNSPMYGALRRRGMSGSTNLANSLQTSFARRGLSQSGIAGMALPIARSSHLGQFSDIDAELWGNALRSVLGSKQAQAGAMMAYPQQNPFNQAFGSSLEVMGPYFRQLMEKSLK